MARVQSTAEGLEATAAALRLQVIVWVVMLMPWHYQLSLRSSIALCAHPSQISLLSVTLFLALLAISGDAVRDQEASLSGPQLAARR
jgi:hypothetical protein